MDNTIPRAPSGRKVREDAYSKNGRHERNIDRQNHSAIEIRFKEVYGKWPSGVELTQARRFLKKRPLDDEE